MQAVIVAGGRGTRLGGITKDMPKPMVAIGDKPLLLHQIMLLKRYGITEIIILSCHLSEKIMEYFGDGKRFGVSINHVVECSPLGTAGAIKEIEPLLKDDFLLIYGDVMADMDIRRLVDFHRRKKSECTLVLHPNDHPHDSDLVEIGPDSRVTAFHTKPHKGYYQNLVNAGLYIMSPCILKHVEKGKDADFGRDIFPRITGIAGMHGYTTPEYLKDIGTPERLMCVRNDYECGKIFRMNIENKRRAVFIDRDGVICREIGDLSRIEDFSLLQRTAEAIKLLNSNEFLAIVVTNQPAVAKGFLTQSHLMEIHRKMETLLGEKGAKLDAIYFCPHHPEKGFSGEISDLKIECECRKPKPGMIQCACRDLNIDLSNSWMIGDSARDIEAGRNAGTKTILVKRNQEEIAECSITTQKEDDLYSAVISILGEHS